MKKHAQSFVSELDLACSPWDLEVVGSNTGRIPALIYCRPLLISETLHITFIKN